MAKRKKLVYIKQFGCRKDNVRMGMQVFDWKI